ncbi:MAG: peroxiredoxin [Woeseiaceae bacterium]
MNRVVGDFTADATGDKKIRLKDLRGKNVVIYFYPKDSTPGCTTEGRDFCRKFDVIHEKTLYGRKHMGVVRSTFLIDADGKLRQEWRNVKVKGHAEEVLEAARAL